MPLRCCCGLDISVRQPSFSTIRCFSPGCLGGPPACTHPSLFKLRDILSQNQGTYNVVSYDNEPNKCQGLGCRGICVPTIAYVVESKRLACCFAGKKFTFFLVYIKPAASWNVTDSYLAPPEAITRRSGGTLLFHRGSLYFLVTPRGQHATKSVHRCVTACLV